MKIVFVIVFFLSGLHGYTQTKPFKFAFISDTHIGSPNGSAEEDLRRTVADINSIPDLAFVVLTGDITELGKNKELELAKALLSDLKIPYYIIPGNHDTGWSETGGLGFTRVFGSDKFYFKHNGIHFIGSASGPYVRMSDGHVPRDAMNWMEKKLKSIGKNEPIIFLNHYPLDNGLDNWYEVVDMLKSKNTLLALCGHGHNNRAVKAEGIPAVMGRSNLRAKAEEGGYNIVQVRKDSILFTERKPVSKKEKTWIGIKNEKQVYNTGQTYPRPDYSINTTYPNTKAIWTYQSGANIISTPVYLNNLIVIGNQNGVVEALDFQTGILKWQFKTDGPIFSSPDQMDGNIVFGSADGYIYSLSANGKLNWKYKTNASVLGSPLINNGVVYIGGSDGTFRALELTTGKIKFEIEGIEGPITSKPVIDKDILVFGAWDTHLYAYDIKEQKLLWKWNNGSKVINFSPAACIPVIKDDVVYVAAPDRYLSAIDLHSGKTLWRTKEATVRESIGMSEDGKFIYGKTMQDTVAAFYTGADSPRLAWKMHVGYGYEHTPSMLIEKDEKLVFGTKNGIVYSVNPIEQKINWAHKIDNSMINTVNVLNGKEVIASTMDGKISLLKTD